MNIAIPSPVNPSDIASPPSLHGLSILQPSQIAALGFESITENINSQTEKHILAGVAQRRNPARTCWLATGSETYQLCILRQDVSALADRTHFAFQR